VIGFVSPLNVSVVVIVACSESKVAVNVPVPGPATGAGVTWAPVRTADASVAAPSWPRISPVESTSVRTRT